MTPILINTGKATILAVKVPDGAENLITDECGSLLFISDDEKYDYELPPGTWRHLENAWELTEEQWKEIVAPIPVEIPPGPGNDFCGDCFYGYLDYELPGEYAGWGGEAGYCSTATKSGHSLLRANQIYQTNPFLKPMYVDESDSRYDMGAWANWQQAQQRTGNWQILIEGK